MSTVQLDNPYGYETYRCENCDSVWQFDQLQPIVDIEQRIAPGETVPGGQCPDPECGALCHITEQAQPYNTE